MDFITIYSAVLFANLLTVGFVWSVMNLARQETAGRHDGYGIYLGVFLMVGFFLVVGIMGATDKFPAWMKSADEGWKDAGGGISIKRID